MADHKATVLYATGIECLELNTAASQGRSTMFNLHIFRLWRGKKLLMPQTPLQGDVFLELIWFLDSFHLLIWCTKVESEQMAVRCLALFLGSATTKMKGLPPERSMRDLSQLQTGSRSSSFLLSPVGSPGNESCGAQLISVLLGCSVMQSKAQLQSSGGLSQKHGHPLNWTTHEGITAVACENWV